MSIESMSENARSQGNTKEDPAGEASELSALSERIEALFHEVRRQGKAAVRAQAAAEACLQQWEQGLQRSPESEALANSPEPEWLDTLMPVFDSWLRLSKQLEVASPSEAGWTERWIQRVASLRREAPSLSAVTEGIRLFERQLRDALRALGVHVEDRTGVAVDPEVHRVVEVRAHAGGSARVLEVIRPGYRLRGQVVREADVVVSQKRGRES